MPRLRPTVLALALPWLLAAAPAPAPRRLDDLRLRTVKLGQAEAESAAVAQARRARLDAIAREEQALAARLGANREALGQLLAALATVRRQPPPPLLVSPQKAKDAVRAAILIRAMAPELESRGQALQAQARRLAALRRKAAAANADLFQAESELAERRVDLDAALRARRASEPAPDPVAAGRLRALAENAPSPAAFLGRLPAPDAGVEPERLAPPLPGEPVRRFGQAWPAHGRSEGWAWLTLPGAEVLSPGEGAVDYAGPLKGWGQVVILRLGGGLHAVLAGLERIDVATGAPVRFGEPLGRAPSGEAPEVYFEVRKGGTAVDPARWLGRHTPGLRG